MYDLKITISGFEELLEFGQTSEFRLLVSLPTIPCLSISTTCAPSCCCSRRAIARPTAPPPMTAWVKSAFRLMVVEKVRD